MPANANRCVVKIFLASRPMSETHHVSIPVHQRIRLQDNKKDIEKYTYHLLKKSNIQIL